MSIRNYLIRLFGGSNTEEVQKLKKKIHDQEHEIMTMNFLLEAQKGKTRYQEDRVKLLKRVIGTLKFNSEKKELYQIIEYLENKLEEFENLKKQKSEYRLEPEKNGYFFASIDKPISIYADKDIDIKITCYRNNVPKEEKSIQDFKVGKDIPGNKKI